MGLAEQIREEARRAATGDDWFVAEYPYVLELRANPLSGISSTSRAQESRLFFVFPLGPENYSVSRVFRQSVTPTLGGLVAEERGLLWRMLSITGTFGFQPKTTIDTSQVPEGAISEALSGPAWTRRMLRNYFEAYANLKANPEFAADTTLIWHDLKTDDHWIVVPEAVDVERNVAKRFQYPWSLRLKAIADADSLRFRHPPETTLLSEVKSEIEEVRQALTKIADAIDEGSRILGEVRFFVATIDDIIDDLTTVVSSSADFVNGVTATISVGRNFITSTTASLSAALDLMEAAAGLPNAVRQNYMGAADGLDAITAQLGAFGRTYDEEAAFIRRSEDGANHDARSLLEAQEAAGPPGSAAELARRRVRSTDRSLVESGAAATGRTFGSYTGSRSHVVQATDSLESLAAKFLGNGALWYDIALFNGLQAPYISETGGPGVVRPGAAIAIPTSIPQPAVAIAAGAGTEPGIGLLGVDFQLVPSPSSSPGRPSVDFAVDRATFRDFKLSSGVANLAQALQMRTWTDLGALPLVPAYGLRQTIGLKNTPAVLSLLRVNYREAIRQDSRVQAISGLRLEIGPDFVDVDVDVIPVGANTAQTISTSLV